MVLEVYVDPVLQTIVLLWACRWIDDDADALVHPPTPRSGLAGMVVDFRSPALRALVTAFVRPQLP